MPELGWFQWIIGGVVAIGLMIAGYLNGRINGAYDSATAALDKAKDNELSTAKLRLHISENYTTKDESRDLRAETTHSLDRIHSRIDDVERSLKEMPQTIVNLIGGKR